MRSYRFARRSFLTGVGAAFGLHTLLRNMEAIAAGTPSPPRFLMTHWPVGTIRQHFLPTGSGTNFTLSKILAPFEALKSDTIILYGLTDQGVSAGQGGGHEGGTPMTTTGANCPGTRSNGGEADDSSAGGPSWDQILLRNVPELNKQGLGYINVICDSRVDSQETSTQCLSYSYTKRSIAAARPAGQMISEAVPLMPDLSPTQVYMKLFSGFMPGGGTPGNNEALLRGLRAKKSVFDYCKSELNSLRTVAPGAEYAKVDEHIAAVQKAEAFVQSQIDNPMMPGTGCTAPMAPAGNLVGKSGSRFDYGDRTVTTADDVLHGQIAKAHAALILAAFQCDLLRVATFQFSPGTNHVSFQGLMPGETNTTYMHHPMSHEITSSAISNGSPPSGRQGQVYEFLANVHLWYNQRMAEILATFKTATDVYGGSVLDHTVVPYITEVAETAHTRSPKPALIFGGRALGMRGGQFMNFSPSRPHNDLWATVAQAYFKNTNPIQTNLSAETFVKNNVAPIPGLWAPPA